MVAGLGGVVASRKLSACFRQFIGCVVVFEPAALAIVAGAVAQKVLAGLAFARTIRVAAPASQLFGRGRVCILALQRVVVVTVFAAQITVARAHALVALLGKVFLRLDPLSRRRRMLETAGLVAIVAVANRHFGAAPLAALALVGGDPAVQLFFAERVRILAVRAVLLAVVPPRETILV